MIITATPSPKFPKPTIRQAVAEFLKALPQSAEPTEIKAVLDRDGNRSPWDSVVATMRSVASVEGIDIRISRADGKFTVRRIS